jgi:hypothetical protein
LNGIPVLMTIVSNVKLSLFPVNLRLRQNTARSPKSK